MKKRLDVLLVERGLAESRAQAQALVMAGRVPGFEKAGQQVDEEAPLELTEPARFVSRGGEKLDHALEGLRRRSQRAGVAWTSARRRAASRTSCSSAGSAGDRARRRTRTAPRASARRSSCDRDGERQREAPRRAAVRARARDLRRLLHLAPPGAAGRSSASRSRAGRRSCSSSPSSRPGGSKSRAASSARRTCTAPFCARSPKPRSTGTPRLSGSPTRASRAQRATASSSCTSSTGPMRELPPELDDWIEDAVG